MLKHNTLLKNLVESIEIHEKDPKKPKNQTKVDLPFIAETRYICDSA